MAVLRFWFSAPFRTRVTFDSPVLERYPHATGDGLARAARAIAQAFDVSCGCAPGLPETEPERRYATLSEDADQQFVTPLFEIGGPSPLCAALEEALQAAMEDSGAILVDAGATRVVVFDNTVAVLEWGVAIDCEEGAQATLLASIDRASFLASAAGVAWIQRELMPVVLQTVDDAFRRFDPLPWWPRPLPLPTPGMRLRRRLARALLRPREGTVFFDISAAAGRNGLMWVTRVLDCTTSMPDPSIWSWTAQPAPPPTGTHNGTRLLAGVGNSVVVRAASDDGMADVVSAYRKMQYLYVLLDIHGRNITRLYSDFLAQRQGVLAPVLKRLEGIQSHLSVMEARAIDVLAGLQGTRARHCQALSEAWDMPGKQLGVHRKAMIAKDMVERFARRQSLRYQKIVQFILAVVGVLALADVVINITAFSHSAGDQAGWGIVKAVRSIAADSLLTTTGIVLAISIVILGLLFRRG